MYPKTNKTAAFSLIELLITLVIAAITLGYAIPSAYSSIQYAQFRSSVDNCASLLQYARTQALQGSWIGIKASATIPNTLEVYQVNDPSAPILLKTLTLNKRYILTPTPIDAANVVANPRYATYNILLSPVGQPPLINTAGQGGNGTSSFGITIRDGKTGSGPRPTYKYTGSATMTAGGAIIKGLAAPVRPTSTGI